MAGDIFEAVTAGDLEAVRAILERDRGAARARDEQDLSPIQLAAYHRRADILDVLLATRPKLDIFEAAAVGDTARVRELVFGDPARLAARGPDGFTALHLAVHFGRIDTARLLLERGAPVDIVSDNALANQPLHAAAACADPAARLAACRLLIESEASVSATQAGGFTPLHAAASVGDRALAELLLASDARRSARSDEGKTPADLAADAGHEELAAFLRSD